MDVYRNLRAGAIVALIAVIAIACTSKFGDTDPDAENTENFKVENRLLANQDLDSKLNRIEQGINRIREVLNNYRQINKAMKGEDVYTQIDFLMDIDNALKNAPAERPAGDQSPEGFIKITRLELPIKSLSPECRFIDAKMETSLRATSVDATSAPTNLTLSVRTCKTNGEFRRILGVTISDSSTALTFDNEGMRESFESMLLPALEVASNCTIDVSPESHVLRSVVCENVVAKLSDSENLVFKKLGYSPAESRPFHAEGGLTENGKLKLPFCLDFDAQLSRVNCTSKTSI
jgi:hypothetical protein